MLGFFSVIGERNAIHPLRGNVLALVTGVVLALWSGIGVLSQAQSEFNTVLSVPRSDWPGFLPRLLRSVELLVVGGGGLILATLISGAVTVAGSFGLNLGVGLRVVRGDYPG